MSPLVPASVAQDSNDVATALDVASALWEKGDGAEAVRWLNRAVEAAGEVGDIQRAADLAQAAGALQAAVESRVLAAPPSVPPPTESAPASVTAAVVAPIPEAWPDSSACVPALPRVAPNAALDRPSASGWIRVSVKTSVRDPKLFVLRPLADGEAAPAGAREGFLVLTDSSVANVPKTPNGGGAA